MAALLTQPEFEYAAEKLLTSFIPNKVVTFVPGDWSTEFYIDGILFTFMSNDDLNQMTKINDFSKLEEKIKNEIFDPEPYVSGYNERFEIDERAFSVFDITVYRNENYSRAILSFVDKVFKKEHSLYLEIRKDRVIYGKSSINSSHPHTWGTNLTSMYNNLNSLVKEDIRSDKDIIFKEREHKKSIQDINIKFNEYKDKPEIVSANVVEVPHKLYTDHQFRTYLFENHLSESNSVIFSQSRIISQTGKRVVVDVFRIGIAVTYKRYEILRSGEGITIDEVAISVPDQLMHVKSSLDCEQNPLNGPVHDFFKDYPPVYKGSDVWITKFGVIWASFGGKWIPLYNEFQLISLSHLNPAALQEYDIWKSISRH
jgi:hypothetical protein